MTGGETSHTLDVNYFTAVTAERPREWLSAVVVWRHSPPPLWRALWDLLNSLLGRRSRVQPRMQMGWSGASGADGRQVLWSSNRGLLRLLERDYALPAGERTLVVLVDEVRNSQTPIVRALVRELPTAIPTKIPRSRGEKPDFASVFQHKQEMWDDWRAALLADAEIGPFWDGALHG